MTPSSKWKNSIESGKSEKQRKKKKERKQLTALWKPLLAAYDILMFNLVEIIKKLIEIIN